MPGLYRLAPWDELNAYPHVTAKTRVARSWRVEVRASPTNTRSQWREWMLVRNGFASEAAAEADMVERVMGSLDDYEWRVIYG